jgi:hypothetical protein
MNVISIVPRLPPSVDGVGDYALTIARSLRDKYSLVTIFLVCDPSCSVPSEIEEFQVKKITRRDKKSFLYILNSIDFTNCPVLLHLSGYGYAKWSLYYWLLDALEEWKKSSTKIARRQLLTMFHETYNREGKLWQHHFWTYYLQKNLALRVASLSDDCITNSTGNMQDILAASRKSISIYPVISTIGEPTSDVKPLISRKRQLVVFGQGWGRTKSYVSSGGCIKKFCELFDIEEVLDIGPPLDINPASYVGLPVTTLGKLPAEAISEILSESIVGWSGYGSSRLGKSSVLAAYAAHGLIPIFDTTQIEDNDGLINGYNYIHSRIDNIEMLSTRSLDDMQIIASNAFSWYQSHGLDKQSDYFSKALVSLSQ